MSPWMMELPDSAGGEAVKRGIVVSLRLDHGADVGHLDGNRILLAFDSQLDQGLEWR